MTAAASRLPPDGAAAPDERLLVAKLDLPRPGVGEDAPPLIVQHPLRLIGVFDGLGGAGARIVDGPDGERTSAWYASRIAAESVRETLEADPSLGLADGGHALAERLAAAIARALSERHSQTPAGSSLVRSSMIRHFPTTAALLLFEPGPDALDVAALWAGDSRCYMLTPEGGLQQLTIDDSRATADAMTALRHDSPMSRMLTADGDCSLNLRSFRLEPPCLLLATTDGSFGSLPSPMHFERVLLEAMDGAQDDDDWAAALERLLAPVASDDISLAALFAGWSGIAEAAAAFAERRAALQAMIEPFESASRAAREAEQTMRQQQEAASQILEQGWQSYRGGYMARLEEPT